MEVYVINGWPDSETTRVPRNFSENPYISLRSMSGLGREKVRLWFGFVAVSASLAMRMRASGLMSMYLYYAAAFRETRHFLQ